MITLFSEKARKDKKMESAGRSGQTRTYGALVLKIVSL
jgi:hypothetical protein